MAFCAPRILSSVLLVLCARTSEFKASPEKRNDIVRDYCILTTSAKLIYQVSSFNRFITREIVRYIRPCTAADDYLPKGGQRVASLICLDLWPQLEHILVRQPLKRWLADDLASEPDESIDTIVDCVGSTQWQPSSCFALLLPLFSQSHPPKRTLYVAMPTAASTSSAPTKPA